MPWQLRLSLACGLPLLGLLQTPKTAGLEAAAPEGLHLFLLRLLPFYEEIKLTVTDFPSPPPLPSNLSLFLVMLNSIIYKLVTQFTVFTVPVVGVLPIIQLASHLFVSFTNFPLVRLQANLS